MNCGGRFALTSKRTGRRVTTALVGRRLIACIALVVGAGGIAAIVFRAAIVASGAGSQDTTLSGGRSGVTALRSVIHHGGALRARISADSVDWEPSRLVGPIRVGFLRTLRARNVEIELQDAPEGRASESLSTADLVTDGILPMFPAQSQVRLYGVELTRVRFAQSVAGVASLRVEATDCRTSSRQWDILCREGRLIDANGEHPFRVAHYTSGQWRVED